MLHRDTTGQTPYIGSALCALSLHARSVQTHLQRETKASTRTNFFHALHAGCVARAACRRDRRRGRPRHAWRRDGAAPTCVAAIALQLLRCSCCVAAIALQSDGQHCWSSATQRSTLHVAAAARAVVLQSDAAADGEPAARIGQKIAAPHEAARRMRLQLHELLPCSCCVAERRCGRRRMISARQPCV